MKAPTITSIPAPIGGLSQNKSNSPEDGFVPVSALKPYPGTPRIHNKKQRLKMRASVQAFGQAREIVVDSDLNIIDGHLLFEVLQDEGYDEVRVAIIRGRSPQQIRELRLILNRIPDDARWDIDKLAVEFRGLIQLGCDNLKLTGFEQLQIDSALEVGTSCEGLGDVPFERGSPESLVVAEGDVWDLGRCHRLAIGFADDASLLDSLFRGEQAQAVFTDLQNVWETYVSTPDGGCLLPYHPGAEWSKELSFLLKNVLSSMSDRSDAGSIGFWCLNWQLVPQLLAATCGSKFTPLDCCVWTGAKDCNRPLYRGEHELILVLGRGEANDPSRFRGRLRTSRRGNVWSYGRRSPKRKTKNFARSCNAKPLQLIADAICDVSDEGKIVFDPFAGEGSTLLAAEITGRCFFGVESDPISAQGIIARWQKAAGGTAIKATTGETFNSVLDRRRSGLPTSGMTPTCNDLLGDGDER